MSKTVRRIITTAIIIIAIIALTIIMVINTSSKTRKNAIDHMKAITAQQASMIESFIENAENTLMGFGQYSNLCCSLYLLMFVVISFSISMSNS